MIRSEREEEALLLEDQLYEERTGTRVVASEATTVSEQGQEKSQSKESTTRRPSKGRRSRDQADQQEVPSEGSPAGMASSSEIISLVEESCKEQVHHAHTDAVARAKRFV